MEMHQVKRQAEKEIIGYYPLVVTTGSARLTAELSLSCNMQPHWVGAVRALPPQRPLSRLAMLVSCTGDAYLISCHSPMKLWPRTT